MTEHADTPAASVSEEVRKVLIAVCTRQRPGMLARLLQSLAVLEPTTALELTVCVVENDEMPHSEAIVREAAAAIPFEVTYLLEQQIGIPHARNRALAYALEQQFDSLLFIDDDEEVEPGWLLSITDFARSLGWDTVVQGCVMARYPEAAPPHLLPFFQRKVRTTGELLKYCACNNTLLPLAPVIAGKLRFEPGLAYSGGEDTVFFAALKSLGTSIRYCREAVVNEVIPVSRCSVGWLSRRKFRVGLLLGSGMIVDKPRSLLRALAYLLKALGSGLQALLFAALMQPERRVRAWLRCCRSLGCSLGFFRFRLEPYRTVDGY